MIWFESDIGNIQHLQYSYVIDLDWKYIVEKMDVDDGSVVYMVSVLYNDFEDPYCFTRSKLFSSIEKAKEACEHHYLSAIQDKK